MTRRHSSTKSAAVDGGAFSYFPFKIANTILSKTALSVSNRNICPVRILNILTDFENPGSIVRIIHAYMTVCIMCSADISLVHLSSHRVSAVIKSVRAANTKFSVKCSDNNLLILAFASASS